MEETSIGPATMLQFRQDIERQLCRHILGALDVALTEERAAALASNRHERTDQRRGYRHGSRERTITHGMGREPSTYRVGGSSTARAPRRNSGASCYLATRIERARSTTRSRSAIVMRVLVVDCHHQAWRTTARRNWL
jgi:hypothetical protein